MRNITQKLGRKPKQKRGEIRKKLLNEIVAKYTQDPPKTIADEIYLYCRYVMDTLDFSDSARGFTKDTFNQIKDSFIILGQRPKVIAAGIVYYTIMNSVHEFTKPGTTMKAIEEILGNLSKVSIIKGHKLIKNYMKELEEKQSNGF